MTWIQTHSAKAFDFVEALDGKPQPIDFNDIAHALSQICRYTGHVRYPYSVAQHSVSVATLALEFATRAECNRLSQVAAWGLMHDAAEAYLGDVSRPLKHMLLAHTDIYARLEDAVDAMVIDRFGLTVDDEIRRIVKQADTAMLYWERVALLPGDAPRRWNVGDTATETVIEIVEMSPSEARDRWLGACAAVGIRGEVTP